MLCQPFIMSFLEILGNSKHIITINISKLSLTESALAVCTIFGRIVQGNNPINIELIVLNSSL
jgi:hypothetical protein